MPLRRHQTAPTQLVAGPGRIDQVAVPVHPQELESGIARPSLARLPMPYGSNADMQQFSGLIPIQTGEHPSIPKLLWSNTNITWKFPVKTCSCLTSFTPMHYAKL